MNLFLVYIFLYFFPYNYGQTVTYNIGIQSDFIGNAPTNLPNYIKVSSFTMPTINTLSDLNSGLASISTYDFIIYTYNKSLVMLTNQNNTPYLVIPEIGNDINLPPNVFYISSVLQQTSDCTRALLTQLNASSIVFLDYQPNPQFKNLVAFNNFTQTLLLISNSTVLSDIFVNTLQYNTENFYVCSIPLTEQALITNLLNEAMIKGQLNPGKVWIFMGGGWDESNFNLFQPFAYVGASIYSYGITFNVNINSLNFTVVQGMVVNDFFLMINNSVFGLTTKPSNLSAQLDKAVLINGNLSSYSNFDPITNKYNGTIINVKQVNTLPTTKNIYYFTSNLTLYNANQVILNLNNSAITVRVGVMLSKGYFMQKPTGEYYGYSVAILNELINLTNFKYVYVFPTNISNQSYSAYDLLNSLIKFNQADIILIPMVISYVTPDAYLSDSVLTMSINILTRAQDGVLSSITLAPFSYNVWLAILLIILLLTLGFWAVSALSPPQVNKKNPKKSESNTFGFSLLVIYSSFVMAKLKIKLLQPSSQVFAFILWFSTLTLIITYASNLVPFLMKTNTTYTFSKAQDLVDQLNASSVNKYVFVRNSIDLNIIQNDPSLTQLYNKSISQSLYTSFVDDNSSDSSLAINGAILLQNSNKNGYIYNTLNCTSDMIRGTDSQYQMVFPMNNNWKQKVEMKNLIGNLILTGVSSSVSIIYFGKGPCARAALSNLPSSSVLYLNRLFLLFLLPAGGFIFGVGFVVLKLLIGKCCRCIQNNKREPFIMGKTYDAKVSSIDNTGVWATINQRDRPYYIHTSNLHPDLRKKYTPKELQIKSGDVLQLKYFGKDPVNGYKRFCKDFSEAEI